MRRLCAKDKGSEELDNCAYFSYLVGFVPSPWAGMSNRADSESGFVGMVD